MVDLNYNHGSPVKFFGYTIERDENTTAIICDCLSIGKVRMRGKHTSVAEVLKV